MANQISKQYLIATNNAIVNAQVRSATSCKVTNVCQLRLNCGINAGGNVNIKNGCFQTQDLSCISKFIATQNVTAKIKNDIEAIAKQLSEDISGADQTIEQTILALNNYSLDVSTYISGTCATSNISQISTDCPPGGIFAGGSVIIDQSAYQNAISNCVFDNALNTAVDSDLNNAVKAIADQKSSGIISALVSLAIVVAVIIGLIIFGPELAASSGIILYVVIGVVIITLIYLIYAFFSGSWPFNDNKTSNS